MLFFNVKRNKFSLKSRPPIRLFLFVIAISTEYAEYQAFSPVVRIGPPKGGGDTNVASEVGGTHSLAGGGRGGVSSDEGTDTMVL